MSKAKNYKVVNVGPLIRIKWEGGGQMPKALSGLYTNRAELEASVAAYEAAKKPSRQAERKVKEDGKKQDTA